jgi:3-oxoacyl-[acyl-carrier protein] reductase
MNLELGGRVALVSGASRGLGRAIARALAAEGCAVAMMARDAARLAISAGEIAAETGSRTLAVAGDICSADDVARVVAAARDGLGPIDIVVANAGGPPTTTAATMTETQLRDAIEQNLLGSVRLVQSCVPGMRERRWGRVLFLTSMTAKMPLAGLLLSNTTRAGLLGFAKTLANEVARDGVTVNSVLPGHFDTDRALELAQQRSKIDGTPVETLLANRAAAIPMGRSGHPDEFASVVAFLASARASFVTGVAVQVDGGQVSSLF